MHKFILKHQAALREAGLEPARDDTLLMFKEELAEVQEQVLRLSVVMKEDKEKAKALFAGETMSGAAQGMERSCYEERDRDGWEEG